MDFKFKEIKGITLIALIVTVVVLIILAGITVATLTEDNGIIKQAGQAKKDVEKADIEAQINEMTIQTTDKFGKIDKDRLIDKLNNLPEGKEIVDGGDSIYIIYPEYNLQIELSTGDVKKPEIEMAEDSTPWELAGEGTEANPYLIESIEDLVAFSNNVNSGENNYMDKYVKLVNTLDFNLPFSYDNPTMKVSEQTNRIITEDEAGTELKTFLTTGTGFNSIGNSTNRFMGNFDGNRKEIRNIYINRPNENIVGLFGYSNKGNSYIKDLGITGNITGKEWVGGIAGVAKIRECYNKGNVEGKNRAGGIVGRCSNPIINCYNLGSIKSTEANAGGIQGESNGVNISTSYNAGVIEGVSYVGGIVPNNAGIISNCYNLNNIKGKTAGGITGSLYGSVKNSYNRGKIEGISGFGGIIGDMPEISVEREVKDNFYLRGTSTGGIEGEDVEGQAELLEESQMPAVLNVIQNKITVDEQEIDAWKEDENNINNGYPILYWQE